MTKTRYKQLLKTIRRASPQARLGVALAVIREIVASFLGLMADAREQVRKFNEQAQDWTGQEGQYFDHPKDLDPFLRKAFGVGAILALSELAKVI